MKKFLVPLDGSELSALALPWATLLAQKFGTQLELLRCYEPLSTLYLMPEFAAPAPVYYDQTVFDQQIDEYLDGVAESLPEGLATKRRSEGDPGTVIVDRTEHGDIEAVVMASHGRGGLGRWLLGSVATKVVRACRVPVLIVNAGTEVPKEPELKKILVPLDGSETSEGAIAHALTLAKLFDAEIVLYQGVAHTPIGHPHLDAAVNLEVQNAREYLDKVKERYPEAKLSTEVKVAGPALGIVEAADACDMIVMNSHGHSGVKRWLLGSVAENVLQTARRPLMIVYQREDSDS